MTGHSPQLDRYFRFLRRLRADGRTNMYGAVPYLMRSFFLEREQAFSVVCQWLDQQVESIPLESVPGKPAPRKSRRPRAA
jgi:hypothetical protein